MASPIVVNLDGDLETRSQVLVPKLDGYLYLYDHDGTDFHSPINLNFGGGTISSVAVGDVNGDGDLNIVIVGDNSNAQGARVRVYKLDGSLLAQRTLYSNSNASGKATACVADILQYIDNDRHEAEEIIIRDGRGQVHILYWNETSLDNWLTSSEWSSFMTTNSDSQWDLHGAQSITPSVSVFPISENATYLVVPSTDGRIHHWTISSSVSSTPHANDFVSHAPMDPGEDEDFRFLSSASLADLTGKGGKPEIIVGGNNGKVYVWTYSSGWSMMSGWPRDTGQPVIASPAVADVNGDGNLEIAVSSYNGNVYLFTKDGDDFVPDGHSESPWPVSTGGPVFASPILQEVDGEVGLEVIAASLDGSIYIWRQDGTLLPGWPKRIGEPIYSTPSVMDLHGAGRMSVVFGDFAGYVYCFDLHYRYLPTQSVWPQFRGDIRRRGWVE
ncbi:MAG: VCBS repeat-containing protein [Candidatus Sumerlaeia bacterium]|nr:VCBS repeat-containing protein [Candidatus Sumerlaeia bacterium]